MISNLLNNIELLARAMNDENPLERLKLYSAVHTLCELLDDFSDGMTPRTMAKQYVAEIRSYSALLARVEGPLNRPFEEVLAWVLGSIEKAKSSLGFGNHLSSGAS